MFDLEEFGFRTVAKISQHNHDEEGTQANKFFQGTHQF